jgi:uncharacterized OsmC-like protein
MRDIVSPSCAEGETREYSTDLIVFIYSGVVMTSTADTALNQVNLQAVGGLVEAIVAEPAKAQTVWAADVHWTGGFQSEARVRGFDATPSDEPSGLGGGDTAPNPVEQLLCALGNCLAVGYAANASVAGIAIDDLNIRLEGDIDMHSFLGLQAGHAGFSAIRVSVDLKTDAAPEAVAALHERVAASSPVGHSLSAPVTVSINPA